MCQTAGDDIFTRAYWNVLNTVLNVQYKSKRFANIWLGTIWTDSSNSEDQRGLRPLTGPRYRHQATCELLAMAKIVVTLHAYYNFRSVLLVNMRT